MKQTLQEHIEMIKTLPQKISQQATEAIVVPEANSMIAAIIRRNTVEGKNSDGSSRTKYSRTPIYATRQQFVQQGAFRAQGKNGNTTKRDGKPNKTMHLPGGYEQLRAIQGRRTDVKNYEYTGDLIKDFDLESQPQQKRVVIGFRSEKQSKKRKGLEARHGAAFSPSQSEIKEYKEGVTEAAKQFNTELFTKVS